MTNSVIGSGWVFTGSTETRVHVIRVCMLDDFENSVPVRFVIFLTIKGRQCFIPCD